MRPLLGILGLALCAAPAAAQSGNQSDVSGPGLTNGGLAGGTYQAGNFTRSENAVFRSPNGIPIWTTGEVACAVSAAIPDVAEALREGPLAPRPGVGGGPVDEAARLAIWQVMRPGSTDRPDALDALTEALAPGAEGRLRGRARSLAEALEGLLGKGTACPTTQDFLVAEQWQEAVLAYARFLDARGDAPASEALKGVHAVLDILMEAGLAAAGRA